MKNLPIFIGVGASRCGTTWTFDQLKKHPQICVSHKKENGYFQYNSDKNGFIEEISFNKQNPRIIGDIDPSYMKPKRCIMNIKKNFPKAKILIFIRNPIERIFTVYKARNYRQIIEGSFAKLLLENEKEKKKCLISDNVKLWMENFECEVSLYDDLKENPLNYIQNIFKFLEVKKNFIPPNYDKWETKPYNVYFKKYPIQITEMESQFCKDFYEEEIKKTAKLLKRNLDHWLK